MKKLVSVTGAIVFGAVVGIGTSSIQWSLMAFVAMAMITYPPVPFPREKK